MVNKFRPWALDSKLKCLSQKDLWLGLPSRGVGGVHVHVHVHVHVPMCMCQWSQLKTNLLKLLLKLYRPILSLLNISENHQNQLLE